MSEENNLNGNAPSSEGAGNNGSNGGGSRNRRGRNNRRGYNNRRSDRSRGRSDAGTEEEIREATEALHTSRAVRTERTAEKESEAPAEKTERPERSGNRSNRGGKNRNQHQRQRRQNSGAETAANAPAQPAENTEKPLQQPSRAAKAPARQKERTRPQPAQNTERASLSNSLDSIFADIPVKTSLTDNAYERRHEALVDSMPPDPTLDAVFADPAEPEPIDPETTTEIVGIRFSGNNKTYYFAPGGITFRAGDHAIVETAQGVEFGEVAIANRRVPNDHIVQPLRPVMRLATPADIAHNEDNHRREEDAFRICIEKIAYHKLAMKLVSAKYTFDNNKLIFNFTTTVGRVDFRELVKTLAGVFHTRIELRQINMRDEAKTIGGFGVCGRRLCCSTFLSSLNGVSLRMAKEQGLSLNSAKISGYCGRLICCLRYEQDTYAREYAILPPVDSVVNTPDGRGTITDVNPIAYTFKVKLEDKPDQPVKSYRLADLEVVTRGKSRTDAGNGDTPDEEN